MSNEIRLSLYNDLVEIIHRKSTRGSFRLFESDWHGKWSTDVFLIYPKITKDIMKSRESPKSTNSRPSISGTSLSRIYIHDLVSKLEERVKELGLRFGYISRKLGHTIILIENSKRVLVWFRREVLRRQSIELFKRIVKDYEYDYVVLVKKSKQVEGIRIPHDWIIVDISEVDEVDKAVSMILSTVREVLNVSN